MRDAMSRRAYMLASESKSVFSATLKSNFVEWWRWQLPSNQFSNYRTDVKQHKQGIGSKVSLIYTVRDTLFTISLSFMPRSRPSMSHNSRQLRSQGLHPVVKGGLRGDAPSTPESEEGFSLAAEQTKYRRGMDSSLEGREESGMEVLPVLDTQHDVGVDADISSEGQADIRGDGSPSPSSQYSFGMDSAPLPEGLDFGMGLTPPPGGSEWDCSGNASALQ